MFPDQSSSISHGSSKSGSVGFLVVRILLSQLKGVASQALKTELEHCARQVFPAVTYNKPLFVLGDSYVVAGSLAVCLPAGEGKGVPFEYDALFDSAWLLLALGGSCACGAAASVVAACWWAFRCLGFFFAMVSSDAKKQCQDIEYV
jgi:hypothetical protein